jgi:ferritin-like metal-binding protein YciE
LRTASHAALELHRFEAVAARLPNPGGSRRCCIPEPEPKKEEPVSLDTLQDLYLEELKDLYSAETQLLKALPKMADAANNDELRTAFREHLEVTQEQVRRLDTIFDELQQKPSGKHCKGMEGLIKEGDEIIQEKADPDVRDAALIAAAQRVEHYEIAGYGTLRTYAKQLGFDNQAKLLEETLKEESRTDERLTKLAEGRINRFAETGR